MPTYAPTPRSFTALADRAQKLFLYRHILREGSKFFDERASQWIFSKAREDFRKNSTQQDDGRVQKYMTDARKALRTIERANQVDKKAAMRVLRLAYGLLGSERHKLLQPFVAAARARTTSFSNLSTVITESSKQTGRSTRPMERGSTTTLDTPLPSPSPIPAEINTNLSFHELTELLTERAEAPAPLHFRNKRTIPPIYSAPIAALIQQTTGKSIEPVLPEPLFKPLHGKREANLRWRHFSKHIKKINPPLPSLLRAEMERKARLGLDGSGKTANENGESTTAWYEWEIQTMERIRTWKSRGEEQKQSRWETGRHHPSIGGKPSKSGVLTLRLYRRMWQQLLDEVTILDVHTTEAKPPNRDDGKVSMKRPVFTVSKSTYSYQALKAAGARFRPAVNEFDKLGMAEGEVIVQLGNKKAKKDRVPSTPQRGE